VVRSLPGSASSLGNAGLICCVNTLCPIGLSCCILPSLPDTGTASGSDTQSYTLNNNILQQHHPLTNPHLISCITVATCNVKACPSPKPLSSENRSRDSYLFCFTANFQVPKPTSFSSSLSLSPSHVATASLPCPIRLEPGFIAITRLDK
jgi:hypothetical protein